MDQAAAGPRRRRLRARTVSAIGILIAALTLSACTARPGESGHAAAPAAVGSRDASSQPPPASGSFPAPAPAAVITAPSDRSANPAAPLTVSIRNGRLTEVILRNDAGRQVRGAISADGSTWHNTEDLGYAKTYRLTASGLDRAGRAITKASAITTLTPGNQTMPTLERIGGYSLDAGSTYGVAIVPVVHFDEPITDRPAAQRALEVSTTPHVAGSWNWVDAQNVHWRPQHYWPAGTHVTVTAHVYGVQVSPGLYGQADASTSFTIGRRQVTVAYDTAPASVDKVRVYNAGGGVIKTMNTSMGLQSGETVNGSYINFYTLDGTYTVLGHEQPARMCSASYGLPVNAPGGYPCEDIYNATKISTDGIYLHELLSTVSAQNNGQDVSHGCLNLDADNSLWFFTHSLVGDPVEIHGAKGAPTLALGEGGDWTVPWSTWVQGSAR